MVDVRFGVLGPLMVWRGGIPVRLPKGRRRALLAALLAQQGCPVPTDRLVDQVWGARPPVEPRGALHTVVSRLRADLGGDLIRHTEGDDYLLEVPDSAIDAVRFEHLVGAAGRAEPPRSRDLLDEALALWRGAAYSGFPDDAVVRLEAQRLDLLRLDAMEDRSALAVEGGEPAAGTALLDAVLVADPYRERAVHLLMTGLYRAGRQAEALATYERHHRRLADELGLDPSPSLRDLHRRILGHDVPLRDAGLPRSAPTWLDTDGAFVGRVEERKQLIDAVADNRVVTLAGVGGVGKSRLVAQSLDELPQQVSRHVMVVELGSVDPEGVVAAVERGLGAATSGGGTREAVVERLGLTGGLLVLDGCEHVVDEVRGLVDAVVRACPDVRVVVTTRRPLGTLGERLVLLEPLPLPQAVELFVDRVRRSRPELARGVEGLAHHARVICAALDGVPMAVEMAATRAARLGPEAVRADLEEGTAEVPDFVGWTQDLLTPDGRALLRALAAVVGPIDYPVVEELATFAASSDRDSAAALLEELVGLSLVSPQPTAPGTRYRMLGLVRTHVWNDLATSGELEATLDIHASWIDTVVARAADEYRGPGAGKALASLDRRRGDIARALRRCLESDRLDLASRVTAGLRLCSHWTLDSELAGLVVEVAQTVRGRHEPSAAAMAAGACSLAESGQLSAARDLGQEARNQARTPDERFLCGLALGLGALFGGDLTAAGAWWRPLAEDSDLAAAHRSDAEASLALLGRYSGDLSGAHHHAQLAVLAAETAGTPVAVAFAHYALGEVDLATNLTRGVQTLTLAVEAADEAGAGHVSMVARLALLSGLVRLGDTAGARTVAVPLLHDEARTGSWPQAWTTLRILAELMGDAGRPRDALSLLSAVDAADSAPPPTGADVARYSSLTESLRRGVGTDVADRIGVLASRTEPGRVLERARSLVEGLAPVE